MARSYALLKKLVGRDSAARRAAIQDELTQLRVKWTDHVVETDDGPAHHLVVDLNRDAKREFWLIANFDTVGTLPAVNNNGSGVVTLALLAEDPTLRKAAVNVRLMFVDKGLDSKLVVQGRRDENFRPGSHFLFEKFIEDDIELIDRLIGAVNVQAVGKGEVQIYERSGRRFVNSQSLNDQIQDQASALKCSTSVAPNSPLADHISLLKLGLPAAVISRYDEHAWRRFQTEDDDLNNVNVKLVEQTAQLLANVIHNLKSPEEA